MGIFSKVGEWLTDKSDRFIRGEAPAPNSYYASDEYEEAYGALRDGDAAAASREAGSATGSFAPVAPQKDYGGRVPYQSQRDLQQRAQEQAYAQQTAEYAQATGRMQALNAQPQAAAPTSAPSAAPQQRPAPQAAYGQPAYNAQPFAPAQQQAPYAQPNNVVPFPGTQRAPDGGLYAHVEYIVLLRSRNECKNVIEYIKQNASVFLNMEFIANDSERQRCVDMLSGAAYTLGCALNKISPRGIYLISSPSVYVVIDPAMQKMANVQESRAYPRAPETYPSYTQRQSYTAGARSTAYGAVQPTDEQAAAFEASRAAGAQSAPFTTAQPVGGFAAPPAPRHAAPFTAAQSAFAGAATGAYQAAVGTGSFQPVTGGARAYANFKQ